MKKYLLFSVMALVAMCASAQLKSNPLAVSQTKSKVMNVPQSQRSFQAVSPRQDMKMKSFTTTRKGALDPAKVKPVTRAQRQVIAAKSTMQSKAFTKGQLKRHSAKNLQPTMPSVITPQAKAPSKAPEFASEYTGTGVDYFTEESVEWTMTPGKVVVTNEETGEEEKVDVLVDVIPTPSMFAELYPEGIPVEYTVCDTADVITIMPQVIASYQNETEDTTFYVTLFSAISEDGSINIEVNRNGKLTVSEDDDWICIGEFAGVEFDPTYETYTGGYELIANVSYYFQKEINFDQTYNAHCLDYYANLPVNWVAQRGTSTIDGESTNIFRNLTPLPEEFTEIYPDGIDLEYEQTGGTVTIRPQVVATTVDEDGNPLYVMISSYAAEDGCVVLTEDKVGLLAIEDESICIGVWSAPEYDASRDSLKYALYYYDNPKYRLPDAPAEKPEDVIFEPEELVLFAGLGYSGYSYSANLAVMGAYAPTTFYNGTFDTATDYEWSVIETDADEVESTITGNDRDFTLNTKGGAVYEQLSLVAYNQKEASDPYTWGYGNSFGDDGTASYESMYAYAGEGAGSFTFTDGTYATMTRQNPDGDLTFYTNWGTPDLYDRSYATIYSYQGKPATPLFITGVTLPLVAFNANDDFNLHLKICKCSRTSTGRLTLGDVIVESDATSENVDQYDSGLTAVEFTELYMEDEFGMSETLDYLFIEDEFVIVIEGWDNGTFSGVLGSQDVDVCRIPSTYFTQTGEAEGTLHYYTSWLPQLFIGLIDATYGYLYTEDETDLKFENEGGTSSIHISPMYTSVDEETEEKTHRLFVESVFENDEEFEGDEEAEFPTPEWLTIEVANEDYSVSAEYDLVVTVDALPEGEQYRTAKVVFFQEGAKLTVTVAQGTKPDGISDVVASTPVKNHRTYNLAGQPVGKNYKGIVVKNGKKVLVK